MTQNIVDDSLSNIKPVPAVLLVGGMGTRLRSVIPSTPKPLAPVGKKSFLELLVRQLRHQGIRRLVMCTGYLADQIEDKFKDGRSWNIEIEYSKEPCPLGTAGAIKLAQRHLLDSPTFLVMNGDSFLEADFHHLIQFHREHRGLATMTALQVTNGARYGRVHLSTDHRVIGFEEKTGDPASGLVSAGVYVFNRAVFEHIPEGPSSLEKDVFPRLLSHGVYALEQRGMFIDIGTPDDYARAQELCDRLYGVALNKQYSHYRDFRVTKA
jgi:D-glycero-alpha-D-manno-heptose 1-phosphate guanylyltransferase